MPLILLPNVFTDEQPIRGLLPQGVEEYLFTLDGLIAESERTGRRYLLKVVPRENKEQHERMRSLPIALLNEHSEPQDILSLAHEIQSGKCWGLISDSGLPCIADPGSRLVSKLHEMNCREISAVPGPSSIFLSLMLSGLSGQRFAFKGYLGKSEEEKILALREIEERSFLQHETQIWIETPYRNQAMIQSCLQCLHPDTKFVAASNVSFPHAKIIAKTVSQWKSLPQEELQLISGPTIFLLFSPSSPQRQRDETKRKEVGRKDSNFKKRFGRGK